MLNSYYDAWCYMKRSTKDYGVRIKKKYWFVKKIDNNVLCSAQRANTISM